MPSRPKSAEPNKKCDNAQYSRPGQKARTSPSSKRPVKAQDQAHASSPKNRRSIRLQSSKCVTVSRLEWRKRAREEPVIGSRCSRYSTSQPLLADASPLKVVIALRPFGDEDGQSACFVSLIHSSTSDPDATCPPGPAWGGSACRCRCL